MRFAILAVTCVLATACGGAGGATTAPAATVVQQPTAAVVATLAAATPVAATPAAPTTIAATPAVTTAVPVTSPAGPGLPGSGAVATVTLSGGPDAGTYTAASDLAPNCSLGLIGPGAWGVQLTNLVAADNELGSVQLVSAAPGMADDENATFKGTEFLIIVTIGPSLGTDSRNYEVAVRTEAADQDSSGDGSAEVSDTGTTAVIHATGTTADGVAIDATINCPSVIRL